jgi:hypothetical protein
VELIKIDGLPAVAEVIQQLLSTTVGTISFIVFVLLLLVIKIPQIPLFQSFYDRKLKRLRLLEEHYASCTDDLFCKTVVEDIRNAIVFEHATRIYAEKNWRKGLVELHDQTNVSWVIMKRARRFMKIGSDGSIFIRDFTLADKFDDLFNSIMTWVFLTIGVIVFVVGFIFNPTPLSIFYAMLVATLLFGLAVIAAFQNLPKSSASILKKRLEEALDNSR